MYLHVLNACQTAVLLLCVVGQHNQGNEQGASLDVFSVDYYIDIIATAGLAACLSGQLFQATFLPLAETHQRNLKDKFKECNSVIKDCEYSQ